MNKYHNLIEWQILKEDILNHRARGIEFLKQIRCPTPKYYFAEAQEVKKDKERFNKILKDYGPFLVIFDPKDNKKERVGYFSVNHLDEIGDIFSLNLEDYGASFIQQIQDVRPCFSGSAVSNGEGKLIVEIIKDTVDVRNLTSCGADTKNVDRAYFDDFDFLCLAPEWLEYFFLKEIKDYTQYFTGYYEFAYGMLNGQKGLFFTSYSDNPTFQEIFNESQFNIVSNLKIRNASLKYKMNQGRLFL